MRIGIRNLSAEIHSKYNTKLTIAYERSVTKLELYWIVCCLPAPSADLNT